MEAIERVPKTALDVFRLLPKGTLCKVKGNILYVASAKYNHQQLLALFFRLI
jgi:hypothetical protein